MKQDITTQKYFIIEGNIGSGKSTFLKMLKQYLNVQMVLEPHEQWQSIGGGGDNLLDLFYKDPKRWAYSFQTYAFVSRIMVQQAHARMQNYMVQVLERSVFSDRYCFAYNCYELGYMNALEWQLYQTWFSWLVDTYVPRPDGFIYLRTNPETCYARLKKRDRHEESMVSLDYIKSIHRKHESWLMEKKGLSAGMEKIPVLILDCNAEFETDLEEQQRHVELVSSYILSCLPNAHMESPLSTISR